VTPHAGRGFGGLRSHSTIAAMNAVTSSRMQQSDYAFGAGYLSPLAGEVGALLRAG
jgi:hypothetical protein